MEKLKSRKFWVAIISAVAVAFADQFGIALDGETVLGFVGIVSSYLVGQSIVDKQKVQAEVAAQVVNLNQYIQGLHAVLAKVQQDQPENFNLDLSGEG